MNFVQVFLILKRDPDGPDSNIRPLISTFSNDCECAARDNFFLDPVPGEFTNKVTFWELA